MRKGEDGAAVVVVVQVDGWLDADISQCKNQIRRTKWETSETWTGLLNGSEKKKREGEDGAAVVIAVAVDGLLDADPLRYKNQIRRPKWETYRRWDGRMEAKKKGG